MAKIIKDREAIKAERKAARKAARQQDLNDTIVAIEAAVQGAQKRNFMQRWYHRGKHNKVSFAPYVDLLGNLLELEKLLIRDLPDKVKQFRTVFNLPLPVNTTLGEPVDQSFFKDFLSGKASEDNLTEEDNRDIEESDNAESVEIHSLTHWLKLKFPNYSQAQVDLVIKAYVNYNDDEASKEAIVRKFLQLLGTDQLSDFVNNKMPEMATEILTLL